MISSGYQSPTFSSYYLNLEVVTFSPHELLACVILPPRTTTSTKIEHPTTNFTSLPPSVSQTRYVRRSMGHVPIMCRLAHFYSETALRYN